MTFVLHFPIVIPCLKEPKAAFLKRQSLFFLPLILSYPINISKMLLLMICLYIFVAFVVAVVVVSPIFWNFKRLNLRLTKSVIL